MNRQPVLSILTSIVALRVIVNPAAGQAAAASKKTHASRHGIRRLPRTANQTARNLVRQQCQALGTADGAGGAALCYGRRNCRTKKVGRSGGLCLAARPEDLFANTIVNHVSRIPRRPHALFAIPACLIRKLP